MGVKVFVQNETRAGAKGGVIEHASAAGLAVRDGTLFVVRDFTGEANSTLAVYAAGFWVSASTDDE